ncbi:MAG: ACP S-malonyltransferase [Bacillota bacterium]|jgi:[acyl-carrier-protein] S-malonyltransferase
MGKLAFVFPGQGSQFVGMGKEISEVYPQAAATYKEADKILGYSISELCWQGPEEELKKTFNTQPAILTTSIACWRIINDNGIVPDFVAGHSLGEYSALVAAGVMDFTDAVSLVRFRGQSMEQAVPSGMGTMAAILGLSSEKVLELCNQVQKFGIVEPANFNCPGQIVIAGHTPAVEKTVEMAKKMGAKRAVMLSVSGPFHSSLLASAKEAIADRLGSIRIKDGMVPLVANVNAQIIQEKNDIIKALVEQVTSPVLWENSVRTLAAAGVDTFVEIGPGKVLGGLIKKTIKDVRILNIQDPNTMENALALLKECG